MISFPGLPLTSEQGTAGGSAQGGSAVGFLTALLQAKGADTGVLGEQQLAELLGDAQGLPLDPSLLQQPATEVTPEALLALMLGAQQDPAGEAAEGDPLTVAAGGRRGGLLEELRLQAGAQALQGAANGEAFQALLQPAAELRPVAPMTPLPIAAAPIAVPVGEPGWGQAVGERMVWTVQQNLQHATIRLDPPHLGPLEISVSVKDDQANVVVQAQHALTREALEAEMPRLRAMLGEAGFTSVDVNVARDQRGEPGESAPGGAGGSEAAAAEGEGVETESAGSVVRTGNGLVDHYA